MSLTSQQTTELAEINEEIDLLQIRLKNAHLLGDNSSAGGISHGYSDNKAWYKELNLLRNRRNMLETIEAGETPSRANLGITTINYVRNDTPYA